MVQTIKNNSIFVNEINQLLHNEGVNKDDRLEYIMDIMNHYIYKKELKVDVPENVLEEIVSLIDSISINKNEISQILFMFYCNKKVKLDLDQFYTPFTICDFICKLMVPGKKVIDPACGTGDLVKTYSGMITLWDINENVLDICKENYKLNNKECTIGRYNSILKHKLKNNSYDYCCLNPPFGSSTVIKDKEILEKYNLGKNRDSQEIGILFIERALNLLTKNGIAFIIIPNGYLGNTTKKYLELRDYMLKFKIIAIIELPSNSFARSGTGISTSLIIIQKKKMKTNYDIYIKSIRNIGYILNKKNTPYKYKKNDGEYILVDNKPVLDNDLELCLNELKVFANKKNIDELNKTFVEDVSFEKLNTKNIESNILDINRYTNIYKNTFDNCIKNNYLEVSDYVEHEPEYKFSISKQEEYLYLDIKQITTPIYARTNYLYGYELPSRAKISLNKNDIILSKLKGKLTFTVILSDDNNIVCSNGFSLLRPKNYDSMIIILANLFQKEFQIQHNSLCTGSIMASLGDDTIKKILINPNIDTEKYKNIINALKLINSI